MARQLKPATLTVTEEETVVVGSSVDDRLGNTFYAETNEDGFTTVTFNGDVIAGYTSPGSYTYIRPELLIVDDVVRTKLWYNTINGERFDWGSPIHGYANQNRQTEETNNESRDAGDPE